MPIQKLICSENGIRLDRFVAENTDITRSRAALLCQQALISVNSKPVKKNHILSQGDIVEIGRAHV